VYMSVPAVKQWSGNDFSTLGSGSKVQFYIVFISMSTLCLRNNKTLFYFFWW